LGLVTVLSSLPLVHIVVAGDWDAEPEPDAIATLPAAATPVTLMDCGGDWGRLEQWQIDHPEQLLILLTPCPDPAQRQTLKNLGVEGYCPKGSSRAVICSTLYQVAKGEKVWPKDRPTRLIPATHFPNRPPTWLYNLRRSGLSQINTALTALSDRTTDPRLSPLDRFVLQGQQRELRAARWCLHQLLPVEVVLTQTDAAEAAPDVTESESVTGELIEASTELAPIAARFASLLTASQGGLVNKSGVVMELDILRRDRCSELIYLVSQTLTRWCDQAQHLELDPDAIRRQTPDILRDLWQQVTLEWLRRYYPGQSQNTALVDLVWAEFSSIAAPLTQSPYAAALLTHLIHQTPIPVDHVDYRGESPEAAARSALLLDHLVLQLANGVMQLVLNEYADVEAVKYQLYDRRYFSTRALTRFRNELSWRFRLDAYWHEPRAIFESRYRLFYLDGNVIRQQSIYGARQDELQQLQGLRWWITIALETRDAIAPRVRSLIAWLGQGVVYVLTQVVGKGLGLVGRGIIQGLGNSLDQRRNG
jgi:DNA-binding NarL/FixJ family response regulator